MKQRYSRAYTSPLFRPANRLKYNLSLCTYLLMSGGAFAQLPPDAGQILQQSEPRTAGPQSSTVQLNLQGQPLAEATPGGQQISLNSIRFRGNSHFTTSELLQLVQDQINRPQDLAGIQAIANRISQHYRDNGYSFAQALIPAQSLDNGILSFR